MLRLLYFAVAFSALVYLCSQHLRLHGSLRAALAAERESLALLALLLALCIVNSARPSPPLLSSRVSLRAWAWSPRPLRRSRALSSLDPLYFTVYVGGLFFSFLDDFLELVFVCGLALFWFWAVDRLTPVRARAPCSQWIP